MIKMAKDLDNKYLKDAIFKYISNNKGVDLVDITSYFNLSGYEILTSLRELIDENKIIKLEIYSKSEYQIVNQ